MLIALLEYETFNKKSKRLRLRFMRAKMFKERNCVSIYFNMALKEGYAVVCSGLTALCRKAC